MPTIRVSEKVYRTLKIISWRTNTSTSQVISSIFDNVLIQTSTKTDKGIPVMKVEDLYESRNEVQAKR